MIAFHLDCIPTAQQRPRHARNGNLSRTYKSRAQEANERTLEAMLLPYRPEKPLNGPLRLSFVATFPIPQSWTKKRREAALWGESWHISKPDLDNLTKQIKDCLTRLRFWEDDKLVCSGSQDKVYGENPGWDITIQTMEEYTKWIRKQ